MQQHWQTLNSLLESVTDLQADKDRSIDSPEIKEAAKSFEKSLQPCLQELSESSSRLISLIENSLKELKQADDVWHSKARITNVDTTKIWEQITILTGLSIKIKQLGIKAKRTAIERSEIACEEIFRKLKTKHFRDKNQNIKSKIGWGDKDAFNKAVKPEISKDYSDRLNKIISEELNSLFSHLKLLDFQLLFNSYSLFDRASKKLYIKQSRQTLDKINYSLKYLHSLENGVILKLSTTFNKTFNHWRGFGDISYREVLDLETKVKKISKSRIDRIISDRIDLINKVIDEIIKFYSHLLEKQNRYNQETPKQRLAEKEWIEQQTETLLKVKIDIQSIGKDFI